MPTELKELERPIPYGVANPYALTEVVLGRKVNWKRMTDPQKFVEKTLKTKYEDLLDPTTSPVLYMGVGMPSVDKKETQKAIPDVVARVAPAFVSEASLSMMGIPVPKKRAVSKGKTEAAGDWTPPEGAVWKDPGDFFEDQTEMADPIQGGLGDCYFIAALASVAWARPYTIINRNRTFGTEPYAIVFDRIEFFKSPGATPDQIDVTEVVPMTAGGAYYYAHSSDSGEIWPAVYEKAYARWKTNGTDKPEYPCIAGGDGVLAASELTGLKPYKYHPHNMTGAEILDNIRVNCSYGGIVPITRTVNPMVAGTYHTASEAPDKIDYGKAGIAANHCYSILGLHKVNNKEYIVLRNPWGRAEAAIDTIGGTYIATELPGATIPQLSTHINLGPNDGVFALGVTTFRKYFKVFGVVK